MYQSKKAMIRFLAAKSFVCFMLAGCGPSSQADNQASTEREQPRTNQPSATSLPSALTQRVATAKQWMQTVERVFDKVNVNRLRDRKSPAYIEDPGKSDENGVTKFFACFDKAPPKCELPSSVTRDGFRKVQFFADPGMDLSDSEAKYASKTGKPSVRGYVSLRDCHPPIIVLHPTFRAAHWMFVEQFSIMLNGAIVIDRKFDSSQVDRNNSHNEVSESIHIVLNEQEVNALRKIVPAQQVLIRLTGQKGYVGVDQDGIREFVQGVPRLLRMQDALEHAIKELGPVKDTACAV